MHVNQCVFIILNVLCDSIMHADMFMQMFMCTNIYPYLNVKN